MLTVILATTTAALFGVSDYLGGVASKRASAFAVTAVAHGFGATLLAAVVLLTSPAPSLADIGFGVLAGVSGGLGVVALYAGLASGRMSVVAPTTAALSGSLPALFDLLRGSRLGPTTLLGIGLALVATVIVAVAVEETEEAAEAACSARRAWLPLALAIVAGVGFAGSFVSFSMTSTASGFTPVLAARATSLVLVGAIALSASSRRVMPRAALPAALLTGALDTAANLTIVTAMRIGPIAVASVLAALYPVVIVILARVFLGERVRGMQRVGMVMALAAVVLTAVR